MSEELTYGVDAQVATITLIRPQRKNAFTFEMIDAWAQAIDDAEADPDVRVVLVTGAGEAFCSGVDLDAFDGVENAPLSRKRMLTHRVHKVASAAQRLSKPMIAAVNGVAVGAGLDMALLCDIRFAARSAQLSEGYIRAGLVPGDGGAWLLPRLVGSGKAMELLMSGDVISADEALRIGMVERVYDDDELMTQTIQFARRLCERSPVALAVIKRAVGQAFAMELPTALEVMSSHMAVVLSTDDYQLARRAARNGQPAKFTGR